MESRDDILARAMAEARDELVHAAVAARGRLDVGPPAPARPGEPDPRPVRRRAGASGCSTAAATRSAAAATSSMRPSGTRPATRSRSPRRRRCAWWSPWPTSTTRAGSTSPASPGTPSARTTSTRPTSGSRASSLPWAFSREALDEAGGGHPHPRPVRLRPLGRDHGRDPAVVRGRRDRVEQLVVEQQRAHERADRDAGERPVVGAAAASEPHAGAVHRQRRHQHHVGGGDRLAPEPRTGRLEQPPARGDQAVGARRSAPSRGRCRGAAPAGSRGGPAARSPSMSGPVPGSGPIETYAATVAARRTSGAASSWSAMARAGLAERRAASGAAGR